jgi:hypothetical protein
VLSTVVSCFRQLFAALRASRGASVMLNDAQMADARIFINSKPQLGLEHCG